MREFKHITGAIATEWSFDFSIANVDIYGNEDGTFTSSVPKYLIVNGKDWEEIKSKPIFTTEDGIGILDRTHKIVAIERGKFEIFNPIYGEELGVWINGWYTRNKVQNPIDGEDAKVLEAMREGFIFFSTKEAANKYILMNKPVLSLKDITDNGTLVFKKSEYPRVMENIFDYAKVDLEALEKLAKIRIKI